MGAEMSAEPVNPVPATTPSIGNEVGALAVRALTKTFPGGRALDEVDLDIAAGEVHALLGENGSGKSTLIKVLAGYHRPDPGGTVQIGGRPLTFGSALVSYQLGARFVHQDLGLVEAASISDNLAFGAGFPTTAGTIRRRDARERAVRALARVDLDLDPSVPIGALSPAQKTGVAVARALLSETASPTETAGTAQAGPAAVRLLVLDEPTARLPEQEVVHLLELVRSVARSGIGVLYVTHRLDEVFDIADRTTVLRDGRRVASNPVAGLTKDQLLRDLFGSALEHSVRALTPQETGSPVLRVDGLTSEVFRGVSFSVRSGEVVGVAGITGSGRDALCSTLFGSRPRDLGSVEVGGQVLPAGSPAEAIGIGVAYVPAERKLQGAFMEMSATENLSISNLRHFWRAPFLRRADERTDARRWFERFGVRPQGAEQQPMSSFSGGNQQKVVLGKWFQRAPQLFLLDEPTQGVDVSAKAELHAALFQMAAGGAAVVMSSSDVEELATACDRVIVIRAGRIVADLVGAEVTPNAMSRAALGIDASDEPGAESPDHPLNDTESVPS